MRGLLSIILLLSSLSIFRGSLARINIPSGINLLMYMVEEYEINKIEKEFDNYDKDICYKTSIAYFNLFNTYFNKSKDEACKNSDNKYRLFLKTNQDKCKSNENIMYFNKAASDHLDYYCTQYENNKYCDSEAISPRNLKNSEIIKSKYCNASTNKTCLKAYNKFIDSQVLKFDEVILMNSIQLTENLILNQSFMTLSENKITEIKNICKDYFETPTAMTPIPEATPTPDSRITIPDESYFVTYKVNAGDYEKFENKYNSGSNTSSDTDLANVFSYFFYLYYNGKKDEACTKYNSYLKNLRFNGIDNFDIPSRAQLDYMCTKDEYDMYCDEGVLSRSNNKNDSQIVANTCKIKYSQACLKKYLKLGESILHHHGKNLNFEFYMADMEIDNIHIYSYPIHDEILDKINNYVNNPPVDCGSIETKTPNTKTEKTTTTTTTTTSTSTTTSTTTTTTTTTTTSTSTTTSTTTTTTTTTTKVRPKTFRTTASITRTTTRISTRTLTIRKKK